MSEYQSSINPVFLNRKHNNVPYFLATKSSKNLKQKNVLIFTKNRKTVVHQLSPIVHHVVHKF